MSTQATQLRVLNPGAGSIISKIGDDIANFFGKLTQAPITTTTGQTITRTGVLQRITTPQGFRNIRRQPFTGRGKIEDVVDIPTGSTRPATISTGTKIAVATTGASLAATTGILSFTQGGQNIIDTFGSSVKDITETVKPITTGAGSVIETFSQSPLLIGGLIILGGILLIKK